MRKMITIAATMLAIFVLASPSVMAGSGNGTGDGNYFQNFYQWLRDDDGDGIPNCLDPDYVRPEDGTGYGKLGPSLSAAAGRRQGPDQRQGSDSGPRSAQGRILHRNVHRQRLQAELQRGGSKK